ncbi:MAG: hypothetical protein ACRD3Y_08970, partial [Bryobacteraceae bacterium]
MCPALGFLFRYFAALPRGGFGHQASRLVPELFGTPFMQCPQLVRAQFQFFVAVLVRQLHALLAAGLT